MEKLGGGKIDADGLPRVGIRLKTGDPYYSYVNDTTGECKVVKYKGLENAVIEDVKLLGVESGNTEA